MRDRTIPGARAALAGLGVVVLLAVVALASRGGLGGGGRGAGPSQGLLSYAFTIFLVLFALAAPFALWAYVVQRGEHARRDERPASGRWLQNVVVFLAFLLLALMVVKARQLHGNGVRVRLPTTPPPSITTRTAAKGAPAPAFEWPVVAVTVVLGLAALAAYLVLRRRREPPARPRAAEELSLALEEAIDDVAAETDPRRAVIKAYARTEAVLAAHGLPRRPAEAPYEYLARALQELEASAASAGRLTALFERARFSLHEIDETMRSDAIEAMTAVRDDLRAA